MSVETLMRAFPGKVDTGFLPGNATSVESRALSTDGAFVLTPERRAR